MSKQLPAWVKYEQTGAPTGLPGEVSLLRAIAEHIPAAAVFVLDQDFRYLLASGGGLLDAGMAPSDFEGRLLADVAPEELLSQYLADFTAIFAGESFVREHSVGPRFYRTHGKLIKGANGARDVALAVSYDITDRGKK
nr:PAS domain-containing protein [uncultured Noviherbaspirillum sp.]